jgi:hypothetical protein
VSWEGNLVELHLSGLTGTASHPDMQKIRIIGFFLIIKLHGSLKFGCYYLHHVPASKPFDYAWFEGKRHNTLLCLTRLPVISRKVSFFRIIDKFARRFKPIRITSVCISGVVLYLFKIFRHCTTVINQIDIKLCCFLTYILPKNCVQKQKCIKIDCRLMPSRNTFPLLFI